MRDIGVSRTRYYNRCALKCQEAKKDIFKFFVKIPALNGRGGAFFVDNARRI